jgi:hypothetical protein
MEVVDSEPASNSPHAEGRAERQGGKVEGRRLKDEFLIGNHRAHITLRRFGGGGRLHSIAL